MGSLEARLELRLEQLDAALAGLAREEAVLRLHLGQALEVVGRGAVFDLGFSSWPTASGAEEPSPGPRRAWRVMVGSLASCLAVCGVQMFAGVGTAARSAAGEDGEDGGPCLRQWRRERTRVPGE